MTNPYQSQYPEQPQYGQGSPQQPGQYPPQPPQYGQPAPGQPGQQYGQPTGQQYGQPAGQQYGQPVPGQYSGGQYGQQPTSPPYGQPQPTSGAPDGQAAIAVTTKYHWLSFMLAFFKPKVLLNGHQLANAWGRNVLPVQPGQHQLHVHVPYFLPPRIGPADLTVPVQPGQVVEVEYRAPMWTFSRGSLGPPPQKYNGAGVMIGLMVALLIIFCLCCGIGMIGSLNS